MSTDVYRIAMDGRWDLKDLYEFPHAFLQVYAFAYVFDTELPPRDSDRINYALESYPWEGGYSIVNIYTVLQNQLEGEFRPRIQEIRYASPGWIDILANIHPVVKVAGAVAAIAGSTLTTTKAYAAVQDTLYKIRERAALARIKKIQLTRQELEELSKLNDDLAKAIGFEKLRELNVRTDSVEVSAKLLSAQFRRLKKLADFVLKGKAALPPVTRGEVK